MTFGICNLPQVFRRLMQPSLKWVAKLDYRYGNRGDMLGPSPLVTDPQPQPELGKPPFRLNGVIQEPSPNETAQTSATTLRRYDAGTALIAERFCSPRWVVCNPLLLGRAASFGGQAAQLCLHRR